VSYIRANTNNNQGWRPGTITLGDLHRGRRVAFRNRLSGLGDAGYNCTPDGACSPCDTTTDPNCVASAASVSADQETQAKNSIFNIGAQLQQANQKLIADENAIRQMNASGTPASPATAQALLQLRQEFESILDKYTTAYRAMFGTTPSGFSGLRGLGLEPVTLAIITTAIAAVGAALYIWWQHEANVGAQIQVDQQRAQTAGTLANQATSIQQQIVDAQARGDSAKVAQLTAQYQQVLKLIATTNPNPNDWSAFFQNNWGWIAAAVGGIFVINGVLR